MKVSLFVKEDAKWWLICIPNAYNDIRHENLAYALTSDTSLSGCCATFESKSTGDSLTAETQIFT